MDPIAGDVHAIWRDSHERYGARKIKAALERRGVTASRRRIVNIMKRRGMTSAYARRTFKPHKTRVNEARLANILDREFDGYEPRTHLASDLTYVRVGGKWAYVCLLIDLANRSIAGHSADTSRTADLVMAAFATLDFPLTEVEVFHTDRGQRVRQRENRQAARRVRHQKIAVKEGQPVRQRRGRIHQQAPEEGAHIPEPLHQLGTTTLRPQRLCVVVQQPKTPLHPRIPESEGTHRTGTRPLRTCPTHRCQSNTLRLRVAGHRHDGLPCSRRGSSCAPCSARRACPSRSWRRSPSRTAGSRAVSSWSPRSATARAPTGSI